ncbi:MAG: amidase [Alphaproteobacteria bacterium]|nr:amidase [Alphaproteobacteria bacterium]
MKPLATLAADLAAGRTTSLALTEAALARIADPAGEGKRTMIRVHAEAARAAAKASDALRAHGIVPSPLAGIPASIKDLFDVAGEVTTAGAVVTRNDPPATADAAIVARLRAAGAVIVGRTNMTEFAYSGIGINPHYDTPRNPWDRKTGRIPGGSSSGAAISVTDGFAAYGIGTDTGGSVRIPAALNGITGLKPTARRVPTTGCFPLSWSLDSIGPLAPSVACCALVDAVLAGAAPVVPAALPIAGLRFAVPKHYVLDDLEPVVAATFQKALSRLAAAGATIREIPFEVLLRIPELNAKGGVLGAESYAIHRARLATSKEGYDPRVSGRILRAARMDAADYIDALALRRVIIAEADATTAPYDACLMPVTPAVAPPIADLFNDDELFGKMNLRMLRNTTVGNVLDRCGLSIPAHGTGEAPVGLMVMGETGGDHRLVQIGLSVEAALAAR